MHVAFYSWGRLTFLLNHPFRGEFELCRVTSGALRLHANHAFDLSINWPVRASCIIITVRTALFANNFGEITAYFDGHLFFWWNQSYLASLAITA
jgi:hypothetical protein